MFSYNTAAPSRRGWTSFCSAAAFLLLLTPSIQAAPGDLIVGIDNPNPQTGARFGHSVDAVRGDVLVGAPFHNTTEATGAGIAYRFTRAGNLVYPLNNPLPTNGDQFGFSVRGWGHHLLIGAPFDEVIGAATGGAVHFARGSDGQVLRAIASPAPLNNSRFGWDIYVLGGLFVAGAPNDNALDNTTRAGAAYLLNRGRNVFTAIQPRNPRRTYFSPRAKPNDEFGYSVSALRQVTIVGAPGDDETASNAGAAFSYVARTARLLHIYENPEPGLADQFGFAVAAVEDEISGVDENRYPQLAIGAPGDANTSEVQTGRVFVFDSATGLRQLTLEDPNPATGNRFGAAVHNVHGNIAVGAPGYLSNTGIAYLFNGQTGDLMATFNNPEPSSNEEFGFSVSEVFVRHTRRDSDANVVVGAPGNLVGSNPSAGSTYLFEGIE